MIATLKQAFVRVWAHKKIILIFYLTLLLAAAAILLPFRGVMNRFAGHSLLAEELVYRLPGDLLVEFFHYEGKTLMPIAIFAVIILTIYSLLSLALSAGAMKIFAENRRYEASLFWGAAAQFFGRFLRVFFWSLPILLILLLLPQILKLVQWLIFGKDPYENIAYFFTLSRMGLSLLGVFCWLIVFDYARIRLICHEDRATRKSLWRALGFIRKNFSKVIVFAAILSAIGLLGFIVYYLLADLSKGTSALTIVIIFFLQQLFIIFRTMLRLTFFAGETIIYQNYAEM